MMNETNNNGTNNGATKMKANNLSDKQAATMNRVVEDFKNGNVAGKIAAVTFDMPKNIPSSKWSLGNRWIAYLTTGSVDARGFNQWKNAGRYVKKGSRAGFIWCPRIVKVIDRETGEPESRCTGFFPLSVFGSEQTEGKPLDYVKPELPETMPLIDVARAWGIEVKADWFTGSALGSCSVDGARIVLNCTAPKVFFHEFAHAAHAKTLAKKGKKLQGGQDAWQEIIAEFSAEVLRRLVGSDLPDTSGNSFDYVKSYAEKAGWDVAGACLKVLRDAGEVVALILRTAEGKADADAEDETAVA